MRKIFIVTTSVLFALLPASALAAPANTVVMGPGSGEAKWTATGSGVLALQDTMDEVGCQPGIHDCYDTLVELKAPGKFTAKSACSAPNGQDVDMQLFESDAAGKVGKELAESAATGLICDESVSVNAKKAAFYIVRVDYAVAVQASADVVATFVATAAPAPAAGPAASTPAADAAPAAKAAKPAGKKVKRFSGTAADDKGVARVEVGLLQQSGSKCKQLTSAKGTFAAAANCSEPTKWISAAGTTKWSLQLKKALRKGRYVLFVRALDSAGQRGSTSKLSFTAR
jgi:hypothetical protein